MLLRMSLAGAVMIAVIALVRAAMLNRLPKKTFVVLWSVAVFRLLVPVWVAAPFSIYSLPQVNSVTRSLQEAGQEAIWALAEVGGQILTGLKMPQASGTYDMDGGNGWTGVGKNHGSGQAGDGKDGGSGQGGVGKNIESGQDGAGKDGENGRTLDGKTGVERPMADGEGSPANNRKSDAKLNLLTLQDSSILRALGWAGLCKVVWAIGMLACALWFAVAYIQCRCKFATSLPVEHPQVQAWISRHGLRREISVRRSPYVGTPLTYGILHPVILLPENMEWENRECLEYVLTHEYVHIKGFDVFSKLILIVTLCIHWFNPMVWLMYFLYNRDLELACDESVVHIFGQDSRSEYALSLIGMEEQKGQMMPLYNGFSKNATEERVKAIMKTRKLTGFAVAAAVCLVAGVTLIFATSGKQSAKAEENGGIDEAGRTAGLTEEQETFRQDPDDIGVEYLDADIPNLDGAEIGTNPADGVTVKSYNKVFTADEPEDTDITVEGMPETVQMTRIAGNGYTISVPENEDWRFTAPDQLNTDLVSSGEVGMWFAFFVGQDKNAVQESLQNSGFTTAQDAAYDMFRTAKTEMGNLMQRVRLVEDVYGTYAVYGSFPNTPEMEEGWGTRLTTYMGSFLPNAQNLSPAGDRLREAAVGFADAYFAKDQERCLTYLSEDAACAEAIKKGRFDLTEVADLQPERLCIQDIQELPSEKTVEVEVECKSQTEEIWTYFYMEFRDENGSFKLLDCGWEM